MWKGEFRLNRRKSRRVSSLAEIAVTMALIALADRGSTAPNVEEGYVFLFHLFWTRLQFCEPNGNRITGYRSKDLNGITKIRFLSFQCNRSLTYIYVRDQNNAN